jgi:CheY-like chemotaxis protein
VLLAVDPLLNGHPVALAVGQTVTAVVALGTFIWASRYARPKKHEPKPTANNRVTTVEGIGRAKRICNPGRRTSDRCPTCPYNEDCVRRLGAPTEAEAARDKAATQLIGQKVAQQKPLGSVLFVDDNAELRNLAEIMLSVAGLRVRVTSGSGDLLPIRSDEDVLVTDWRLADGVTGGDIIRAYREVRPDRPVIVVSALDHEPREMPVDAIYIRKPFNPDDLCRLIQSLLEK